MSPVHPGEILDEEFLKPMELSQNRLALPIGFLFPELMKLCREKEELLLILF